MTRRNTILLVAVAAAAAIGAYWMLVLTPKREEAAAIDKQISAKQAQLAKAEAEVADYDHARSAYKANYSMVARLGKAVPADDDVRSLLVQINSAADHSGVDFRTINVGGGSGASSADPAAAGTAGGRHAAPGRFDGRHRRLLDHAVLVRLQGQLLRAGRVLQPPRPLRGRQGRGPRRDGPAAAAQQHHAHPGHREGIPRADRRGEGGLLPAAAHRGPDRRRDP